VWYECVKKTHQIFGVSTTGDHGRWSRYARAKAALGCSGAVGEKGKSVTIAEDGNWPGAKVMVIDDSQTIRKTAETLLTKEGYTVITAGDGFEALSKVADHRPDVIFIDIMMPRLDGYQACALIKANPQYSGTPVIMLSSKDGLFDRARGRIVGSDEYLTKPFTKDELLGAVRTHLARKAG
jgi:twitching motility two-component system response regulator PilG